MDQQRIAFEPFRSLEGVLRGEPIKIMPLGTFYRGSRKIEITEGDLTQIADNVKAGLPRFRIPINENHAGVGKVGTVAAVEFSRDGADGPGLYATKYELTDEGRKLVEQKRFDAVSPEMVWKKNGATYQDPQTGKEHDAVLVGLALTERPFFGHDNVALFSETPGGEAMADDMPTEHKTVMQKIKAMMQQMMTMLGPYEQEAPHEDEPQEGMSLAQLIEIDGFKDYDAETRREFAKKGWAMPDGSYPIADGGDLTDAISAIGRGNAPHANIRAHIVKRAKALGLTDKLPADWEGSTKETAHVAEKGKENMADNNNTQPTPPSPEVFTVKAEEFKALQDKAALVDGLKTQADTYAAKIGDLEKMVATERRARELASMTAHAENFYALSVKVSELAENLLQLKETKPELFTYFDGLLKTADKQLGQSELFAQRVSEAVDGAPDTFEALIERKLAEKFNGDRGKYSDAMKLAEQERPDLAREYVKRGA